MSDDLLVQQVEAENAAVLGVSGAPIDRMTRKYPRALRSTTLVMRSA
jgi:hypothetical protein